MASESAAASVALPVVASERVLRANPQLAALLRDLPTKITRDGVPHQVDKAAKNATVLLEKEKMAYFTREAIVRELHTMIADTYDAQLADPDERAATEAMKRLVATVECENMLPLGRTTTDTDSASSLLGLDRDTLRQSQFGTDHLRQHIERMRTRFLPQLEQRLEQRGEMLATFFGNTGSSSSSSSSSTDELHVRVGEAVRDVERARHTALEDASNAERQFYEYFQTLTKLLDQLIKLVEEYRLRKQFQVDTIESRWEAAHGKALILKLSVLKTELLHATYTADTVPALKHIRKLIATESARVQKKYNTCVQRLREYDEVGEEFSTLAREYAAVQDDMRQKQWTLKELGQQ